MGSVVCIKCKIEKSEVAFPKRYSKRGGRKPWCTRCHSEYNRQRYHASEDRRTAAKASVKARRVRNQHLMNAYLADKSCLDCGETDPVVLEFDHLDAAKKRDMISVMVGSAYAWETIMAEIDKCQVVCANCHRRRSNKIRQTTYKSRHPGVDGLRGRR